jgi:cob(I)alamin adenosyltransferase
LQKAIATFDGDRNVKTKEIEFAMVTTRGGDRGESSLYNGERRRKDDIIFEALGDLDELNSALGVVRAQVRLPQLLDIQKHLLMAGAAVATPKASKEYQNIPHLQKQDVENLEKEEKALLGKTEILGSFVCPGETVVSAQTDVARTLARRCERRLVTLIRDYGRSELIESQRYLNRLSDYLFILARFMDQRKPL